MFHSNSLMTPLYSPLHAFPPRFTSINWITGVGDTSPAADVVLLSTGSFRLCGKENLQVILTFDPQNQLAGL